MGHTFKDKPVSKAVRQPKVQKKQRKDNYTQNLTANVDLFLEHEDDGLEDDGEFETAYSDDTADYPSEDQEEDSK